MSMSPPSMADLIRSTMGFPTPVSSQLLGWASGVIQEITSNALVSNLPGTITGTTAPGSSLSNGAGMGGLIAGMSGGSMASKVVAAVPYPYTSTQLTAFCNQIVLHIQSLGMVNFDSGNITGTCTNTPLSPGPLVAGAGSNGKIIGLSGPTLAAAIHAAVGYPGGVSLRLIQFCTAIVSYIMDNAAVSYATGTVNGLCPPGGGPLSAGAGVGGTIA